MARIDEIARTAFKAEEQSECAIDEERLLRIPELKTHPVLRHSPLNIRDHQRCGRTEAMLIHYKIREG